MSIYNVKLRVMRKVILICVLLASGSRFTSSFSTKNRGDPNYSEEYNQVFDANLTATLFVECNVYADERARAKDTLVPILQYFATAFQNLNIMAVELLACREVHDILRLELKSVTFVIKNSDGPAISSVASDVLVVIGTSLNKNNKGKSTLQGGGASNVGHEGIALSRRKLSIYFDLNFQSTEPASPYDIVLLLSKTEGHHFSNSWLSLLSQRDKLPPPPEIYVASALSSALNIKTKKNVPDIHIKNQKTVNEHHRDRNNTISIWIPDILSPASMSLAVVNYCKEIGELRVGADKTLHRTWFGELNVLWGVSTVADEDTVKNALSALVDVMTSEFNKLEMPPGSNLTYVRVPGQSGGGGLLGETDYSEALQRSSVLWIRIPLLHPSLATTGGLSEGFSNGNMTHSSSSNSGSSSSEVESRIMTEWLLLRSIEGAMADAQLYGCLPILSIETDATHNEADTIKTAAHERVFTPREYLGWSYKWLIDSPTSYAARRTSFLNSVTVTKVFSVPPKKQIRMRAIASGDPIEKRDINVLLEIERLLLDGIIKSTFRHFIRRKGMTAIRALTTSPSSTTSSTTSLSSSATAIETPSLVSLKGPVPSREYAAVIIESRLDPAFEFVVRNVMYHLGGNWSVLVLHSTGPSGNELYVKRALADLPLGSVEFVPADSVNDGQSYNRLMKHHYFWDNLKSRGLSKVFIFQTDSVMLRRGIEEYMHLDYIGAPWHSQEGASSGDWLRALQRKGTIMEGVGNGGSSLRTVSSMLQIAQHAGGGNNYNEDLFFAYNCEKATDHQHGSKDINDNKDNNDNKGKKTVSCRLATRQIAYTFAVEIPLNNINITLRTAPDSVPFVPSHSEPVGVEAFLDQSVDPSISSNSTIPSLNKLKIGITKHHESVFHGFTLSWAITRISSLFYTKKGKKKSKKEIAHRHRRLQVIAGMHTSDKAMNNSIPLNTFLPLVLHNTWAYVSPAHALYLLEQSILPK